MTEENKQNDSKYLDVKRRDVMKAAGAATVGGLIATGNVTAQDACNCQSGFLGSESACLTGREGCSYCKIDSLPSVGTTCSIEGTESATITRTSGDCIEFSDPDNELCKIALKAGSGEGSCTVRDVAGDTSGNLCTQNGKDISNIQFEFLCDECPGDGVVPPEEECDYENDAISSTSFSCTQVSADLTGVEEDCPVQVRLTYYEDGCTDDLEQNITSNQTVTFTVPDCCTPQTLYLEQPDGTVIASVDSGLTAGECVNENLDEGDFDVQFCCNKVTVSANADLECPVTATLNLEGADCASATLTQELSAGNREAVFTIEGCECEPVSLEINGFTFEAPDLTCQCENFQELCKIEAEDLFYDEEGNLLSFPRTVSCGGVEITITDVQTKDGEVTCFHFTSSEDIFRVFVKGGGGPDAGETYTFPCGTTDSSAEGEFLCANVHPQSGQQTAVSNVTFYVCADDLDYC